MSEATTERLLAAFPAKPGRVQRWYGPTRNAGDGHQHPEPALICCLAGSAEVHGADASLVLAPGGCLAIAPGVRHRHVAPSATAAWLRLDSVADWTEAVLESGTGRQTALLPGSRLRPLLQAVLHAAAADLSGAVGAVLATLRAASFRPSDPPTDTAHRLLDGLWGAADLPLTPAELVRRCGLDPATAESSFRRRYGLGLQRVLVETRLAIADALVADGHPTAVVARRVGCADRRSYEQLRKAGQSARRST